MAKEKFGLMDTVSVKLQERSYPVYIGNRILQNLPEYWEKLHLNKRAVIITHQQIKELYAEPVRKVLKQNDIDVRIIDVPEGETAKSWTMAEQLLEALIRARFERQDVLIALGGGVIGDLAGFVASVFMRGVPFVQIPTTLMAQVDSSLGGKTGVNHPMGKNLIGTFYQPKMTVIDVNTLKSLPPREIYCGLAEIVKYGIITNADFFTYCEDHKRDIKEMNFEKHVDMWGYLIAQSCRFKSTVVSQDERECGLREILNFGHTIAHAIESVTHYQKFLHGEAVALGMRVASEIAFKMDMVNQAVRDRIVKLLTDLGFALTMPGVTPDALVAAMFSDKKVRGGQLRFVLPVEIGKVVVRDDVPEEIIQIALQTVIPQEKGDK